MKVPVYERQVGETVDTGSRMLTAQINPNTMAAPYKAVAELGNTITKAGLEWYGHELKLKRSIEETNASTTLAYESKRLANRITLGETQKDGTFIPPVSPKDMTSVYKLEMGKIVNSLQGKFVDKVAQKRFIAKVSSLVANDQLGVMKLSRNALVDERQAQFNSELNNEIDIITSAIPGTVEYNDAFIKLFGDDGKKQNAFGLGTQKTSPVKSIFQRMIDEGIYNNVDAQKLKIKTEQDIEILSITKDLIASEETNDDNVFDVIENKIQKNKKLSTTTKQALLKQVDTKKDTWINAKNREEEKETRLNDKLTKKKQNNNYGTYTSRIINWKTTGDWDKEGEINIYELTKLANDGDITVPMFESLNKMLVDTDAQETNGHLKKDLLLRVLDSQVTNNELDAIISEVPTYFGFTGTLKYDDGLEIIKLAENRKKTTRDTEQEDFYLTNLTSDLDALLPDSQNRFYITLKTQAISEYAEQLNILNDNGTKKYKPEEIYKGILERIKQSTQKVFTFPLYPKYTPNAWKKIAIPQLTEENIKLLENDLDKNNRNWFDVNNINYNGLSLKEINNNIDDLKKIQEYFYKFKSETK